jgi:hypothetical protein
VLIYDHNKEFIGIDQESLKVLGYERFEDLIHEHKDVAELFVKKPGYIHNFTNFPWIDFVLHAESDDAKVIIAGKAKAFSATIEVTTLHLKNAPEEEAFLVKLKNIQDYHLDASERPEPSPVPFEPQVSEFNAPSQESSVPVQVTQAPIATPEPELEIAPPTEPTPSPEPLTFDEDVFTQVQPESVTPITPAADEELDIFFGDEELEEEPRIEVAPEIPKEEESIFDSIKEDEHAVPMLGANLSEEDKAYLADLEFDEDYIYDPQIAADELGLPVDLIEEFIGDFIKQAHEFKEQLFTAIDNRDFDNIKILSHKLKGVAANLRIEDSFEVLRNINETSDIKECEANLKRFYLTIAKLEGKDPEEAKRELEKPPEEDLYDLTPKHIPEEIVEEDIIQPLDLPDFEEDHFEAPESLENLSDIAEQQSTSNNDDEIYDFGLVTEEGTTPLMVLDDEEEIISDLENFDTTEEPELISGIQDFDTDENTTSENLPVLTYDITVAAAEIGLSPDLVSALIEDYIVEANEMRNKLNEVITADDMMRWKGYAVQLKGVSDNLRIKEISEALQNLIISSNPTQAKAATQEFYGFINQL